MATSGPELVLAVLGARHPGVGAAIEAFGAGAADGRVHLAEVKIDEATSAEQLAEVVRRVRVAAGLVLITGESYELAHAHLRRLHDAALELRSDPELIGAFAHALATTLVAGPADEAARSIVHGLNAELYDLGALIVSPGFGERALAPWFDNRPGGTRGDGSLTPESAMALERHGRRVAWLAGLLAGASGELAKLQL